MLKFLLLKAFSLKKCCFGVEKVPGAWALGGITITDSLLRAHTQSFLFLLTTQAIPWTSSSFTFHLTTKNET
jgi:hypothetical protein